MCSFCLTFFSCLKSGMKIPFVGIHLVKRIAVVIWLCVVLVDTSDATW